MLRDKSLIPLSHQHQHALALCVRIDRATPVPNADLEAWQAEIAQHFQQEISIHFAAEESVLFPAAREFAELAPVVEELLAEHAVLCEDFASAQERRMTAQSLRAFAQRLTAHVRKEERQLFEGMQKRMSGESLAKLGLHLDNALKDAAQACVLPSETTRWTAKR
ncbi:MAG: hemerythrin domain-containing protein [Acidobacteriia bacterium]|nr:hemerythrin domain-containing protein [Terriglobia bacterium]